MVIGGSSWRVRSTCASQASRRGQIQIPKDSKGERNVGRKEEKALTSRGKIGPGVNSRRYLKGTIQRLWFKNLYNDAGLRAVVCKYVCLQGILVRNECEKTRGIVAQEGEVKIGSD